MSQFSQWKWMVLSAALAFSCSDYKVQSRDDYPHPGEHDDASDDDEVGTPDGGDDTATRTPPDTGGEPDTGPGPDTGDTPWSNTNDPDNPPIGEPPDRWVSDCDDIEATFDDGELAVLAWDPTSASGTLEAPIRGWYHIYSTVPMESGASQMNESAYFRIINPTMPDGLPVWSNCESEWVVEDADNDGKGSGGYMYIGTFWLDEGTNALVMYHYCLLYRDGTCSDMHNEGESTCESTSPNSVHFDGEGICTNDV